MEELKKSIYRVSEVRIAKLRGTKILDYETSEEPILNPRKINIVTGCNGSFKTSFLEALTISLCAMYPDVHNLRLLSSLASTLRMDPFWHYFLVKEGIDVTINGYKVISTTYDEVVKVQPSQPLNLIVPPVGIKLVKGDKTLRILRIDIYNQPPIGWSNITVQGELIPNIPHYKFIAFSTPNPLTPEFISNFTPLISFATAKDTLKRLLNIELLGVKVDELNRLVVVIAENSKDVEIQFLGSGLTSFILLTLASSLDIVIYDNIENHLHPQLMLKAIKLMKESNTQWFITTQSEEFLKYLLTEIEEDIVIYEFIRRNEGVYIRQIDGKKAKYLQNEVLEDLRGIC
jgi:hypothetical protein